MFSSNDLRGPLVLNALAVSGSAIAALWRRRYPLMFMVAAGAVAAGHVCRTHTTPRLGRHHPRQLDNRGFFYRFFGRWMNTINKEWQMYPVGVVFGMGFDTATEVALLATTALLASQHIPWYAILCLPILFTAGMTLMDTTDGLFMNLAYGWAFFNPVRKVYYNLAITGLSVATCFFIGGIEVLGLLPTEIHSLPQGGFWGFMENFDINKAGFVIVGLFIITWATAMLIWRYGHIEERWTARLAGVSAAAQDEAEELIMTRTDPEEQTRGSQRRPEEPT